MKALLLAILLWQATGEVPAPNAEQRFFRYTRAVTLPTAGVVDGAQTCATLDASVYAHGAPTLKDLRLYEGQREVPYAITLSESAEADSEPAKVMNLGMRGDRIVFDLGMPSRPYTEVMLGLEAHNFIATAEISGSSHEGATSTKLGTFTLFDLSAQHLSRNTTLHLQESTFPILHVELKVTASPEGGVFVNTPAMVQGASVPPSREAQTIYTTVAEAATVTQRGHQTIAAFRLPAHVPVERVSFVVAPVFRANFSRNVLVTGRASHSADASAETLTGSILRVHMDKAGREIDQEELHVPATLGANLETDAMVEVLVENGNDAPLAISSVRLEMRQRRICFSAPTSSALTLFYGDAVLDRPVYDYTRLFSPAGAIVRARLGEEQQNAAFVKRPEGLRPLTERHPEILWIVLLAVVCVLAVIALHSARRMPK